MSLKYHCEPKTDCFAYNNENGECRALTELVCGNKEKCPFYKHHSTIDRTEIERAVRNYKA